MCVCVCPSECVTDPPPVVADGWTLFNQSIKSIKLSHWNVICFTFFWAVKLNTRSLPFCFSPVEAIMSLTFHTAVIYLFTLITVMPGNGAWAKVRWRQPPSNREEQEGLYRANGQVEGGERSGATDGGAGQRLLRGKQHTVYFLVPATSKHHNTHMDINVSTKNWTFCFFLSRWWTPGSCRYSMRGSWSWSLLGRWRLTSVTGETTPSIEEVC